MSSRPLEQLLSEGEEHVHSRRFAQGEACAAAALQRQPRNSRAHYVMGLSALFQQRPGQALGHFEQALRDDRVNPQYHFVRGMCLSALQRTDEAVAAYRRALQFRPQFFEALANLGNVQETAGRHADAAEAYRRALVVRPDEPLVLNGLGACELASGRPREAVPVLERAIALRPEFPTALNNLANALVKGGGDRERAVGLLRRAVALRPDFIEAWMNLAEQLYMRREDAAAIEAFDRVIALDPANDEARYVRDSIAGVTVDRAPDQFVRNFFDRFAGEFEQRLTQDLGYRAPEQMAAFLGPWLGAREGLRVADLGCGTGLSGVFIRGRAARLVGVDLSGEMLARARARGLYDELAEREIAAYLGEQAPGGFDLVLAADVFVYVGNLRAVFDGCAAALAPGGCFAFSVEHLADGPEGFRLARTGRYAHSEAYVRQEGERAGLRFDRSEAVVLRHDDGQPVHGCLYAFVKP